MKRAFLTWVLAIMTAVTMLAVPSVAHADITITPTRLVFEDRDRFKDVTLVNTSGETKTYDVGWEFYRMVEENEAPYVPAEASLTEFDLSQYIVHTPRRVTLAPGGKQKIRLALRRPPEVAPGEYRAHMIFKALREDNKPVQQPSAKGRAGAAVSINVSFSIPVIFRAGTPNETATIESTTFERNQQSGGLTALVKIVRSDSPYGVLGHLYIYNSSNEVIGEISNAHIFPEVRTRTYKVPLKDENLSGTSIRVVLKHYDKSGDRTYAERSFPVR